MQNTVLLVEDFNDQVRSDLYTKGFDNSFTASDSIRTEVFMFRVVSKGVDYLYYLDVGRAPGKFPPPESIKAWVESRALTVSPYVIGRKIAREGTEIYKNPSKGIQLDEKRRDLLQQLNDNAPKWAKQDIINQLKLVNNAIK